MTRFLLLRMLFGATLLTGCTSSRHTVYGERNPTDDSFQGIIVANRDTSPKEGCLPVPEGLDEMDLVGVWRPRVATSVQTTLILKEDRTYRQIYSDPDTGHHYESSGQDHWWVEKLKSEIWRLHLEGMKMCDNSLWSDCARYGDQARKGLWFDYCEGEGLDLTDEVVLLVIGADPESVFGEFPRGILLKYPIKDPDTPTGSFQLVE